MAALIAYEVIVESPEAVRDELRRLWTTNLGLAERAEAHFERLYHAAPQATSSVLLLRARWPDGRSAIVGTNSLTRRRFQLAPGQDGLAAVSGDLAVDLEHRSLLPALRLTRAAREQIACELDLGYGFPNPKAEGVMARAGFSVLGKATRHVRVLRHAQYLAHITARLDLPPWLARVAMAPRARRVVAPLVDLARIVPYTPLARLRGHLAWAPSFDVRFDELWQRARGDYQVIGERTSVVLRWRYPRCEIATLVRANTLVAYAIVQRDPATRAAHLRDVFGVRRELPALIDLLVPSLYRRGATTVSVQFLGAPDLLAHLARRGFEPRGARTTVVQVGAAQEAQRARLLDSRNWHLFEVDEDT